MAWSWGGGLFLLFRGGRNANPGRPPAFGNRESLSGYMSSVGACPDSSCRTSHLRRGWFQPDGCNRACAHPAFLAAVISFWFINRAHSVCSLSGSACSESAQPLWNQHGDIPGTEEQRAWPQHPLTGVEISALFKWQGVWWNILPHTLRWVHLKHQNISQFLINSFSLGIIYLISTYFSNIESRNLRKNLGWKGP